MCLLNLLFVIRLCVHFVLARKKNGANSVSVQLNGTAPNVVKFLSEKNFISLCPGWNRTAAWRRTPDPAYLIPNNHIFCYNATVTDSPSWPFLSSQSFSPSSRSSDRITRDDLFQKCRPRALRKILPPTAAGTTEG